MAPPSDFISTKQETASNKPRRWNERGDKPDEVVVHVARVAQGRCTRRHDSGNHLVDVLQRRVLYVQPLGGDVVERRVVEHDDRVCVQRQPLHRQDGVVWLDDDVGRLVREDAVGLYEFLRVPAS